MIHACNCTAFFMLLLVYLLLDTGFLELIGLNPSAGPSSFVYNDKMPAGPLLSP
jgi:hypothetical protein